MRRQLASTGVKKPPRNNRKKGIKMAEHHPKMREVYFIILYLTSNSGYHSRPSVTVSPGDSISNSRDAS